MLVADAIIHLTSNTVAAIQLLGDSNSVYKFPCSGGQLNISIGLDLRSNRNRIAIFNQRFKVINCQIASALTCFLNAVTGCVKPFKHRNPRVKACLIRLDQEPHLKNKRLKTSASICSHVSIVHLSWALTTRSARERPPGRFTVYFNEIESLV